MELKLLIAIILLCYKEKQKTRFYCIDPSSENLEVES